MTHSQSTHRRRCFRNRWPGRVDTFGYRKGNTFLASLACEHKRGWIFGGVAELDFRDAKRDRFGH